MEVGVLYIPNDGDDDSFNYKTTELYNCWRIQYVRNISHFCKHKKLINT